MALKIKSKANLAIPAIGAEATAGEARARLQKLGWTPLGAGDWSWALADPGGAWVARVTPFDPGYRMFAGDCLSGPANRWLPDIRAVLPLRREAYAVIIERLWPADEAAASAFCAALGIANDTGYAPPRAGPGVAADDPDLVALRGRLRGLIAQGARRYRLWAGSDIREGNVMADAQGRLKLIDPIGVAGWKIVGALREGRADLLADFTPAQLADILSIPFFGPGREGHAQVEELRAQVARLHGGTAAWSERRSS